MGPGKIELKEIQKRGIEKPTDAMSKSLKTTICGIDLDEMLHAYEVFGNGATERY